MALGSQGDARNALVVKEVDPRIHFALVCGAKSCPPIRVFSAANLEFGLAAAAKNFLDSETTVTRDGAWKVLQL